MTIDSLYRRKLSPPLTLSSTMVVSIAADVNELRYLKETKFIASA